MLKPFAWMPVLFSVAAMSTANGRQQARLQLAHRVLDAMQFDKTLERYVGRQVPPEDTAAMNRYRAFLTKCLDVRKLRDVAASKYAELYSEQELTALEQFFGSATGRKYTELQPEIGDAVQPLIVAAFRDHAEEFRREVLGLP